MPPPDLPDDVRDMFEEVLAGRAALEESRNAVLNALPANASRREQREAMAQWYRENAPTLAQQEQLEWELRSMEELYRAVRQPPDMPDMPAEIDAKLKRAREIGRELLEARRASLSALGPMPTLDQRAQALQQFRQQEQVKLRELRSLLDDLKTWWRTQDKGPGPRGLDERRAHFAQEAERRQLEREALRQALEAAETPEERAAILQEYRARQAAERPERPMPPPGSGHGNPPPLPER